MPALDKPFLRAVDSGLRETFDALVATLDGLTVDELNWRPTLESNTISWLVWHMARVEDGWINVRMRGGEPIWDADDWATKLGIDVEGNGYGQSGDDIRNMPPIDVETTMEYYRSVRDATSAYFADEAVESDLDRVVVHPSGDRSRDVTFAWVLGHLLSEEAQHLGQIAYLRGMMLGINQ